MKKLLRPGVLIPLVVVVALLASLFLFTDITKVVSLMRRFQRSHLLYFLLLTGVYTAVRGIQWHVLLRALDLRVPLRTQIFAFLGGEVTKYLPIGNYFQNYLLLEAGGSDFGRSAAASTLVILEEVAVSLGGLVIIGLDDWGWLRPVIVIGLAVFAVLAWGISRLHSAARAPRWLTERDAFRKALDELKQFREAAADLIEPRTLAVTVLLGAVYTAIGGVALYVVLLGLGLGQVSFWQVLAVYYFSLAFTLIFPLPIDIGVLEVSGVSALLAIGLERNAAVGVVLINRVLGVGSSIAIAAVAMIVLRDQLQRALTSRKGKPSEPPAQEPGGSQPCAATR